MKLLILALSACIVLAYAGVAVASQQNAANPPIALTPGSSQPITCAYTLGGTLNEPICPAATATPTPQTVIFTLVNAPGEGLDGLVTCNNGNVTYVAQGTRQGYQGSIVHCTPGTPLPTPTP